MFPPEPIVSDFLSLVKSFLWRVVKYYHQRQNCIQYHPQHKPSSEHPNSLTDSDICQANFELFFGLQFDLTYDTLDVQSEPTNAGVVFHRTNGEKHNCNGENRRYRGHQVRS